MTINLCYFIVYIFEAIIFGYYCNQLFKPKASMATRCLYIGIAYSIQFLCSFFRQPVLNTLLFVILNTLLMIFLYRVSFFNTLLHNILLVASMSGAELMIAPLFSNNFWLEQSNFYNLFVQAPLCKFVYFLLTTIIIYTLKSIQAYKHTYTYKANIILILITLFVLVILYSLVTFYTHIQLSMYQRIWVIIDSLILLTIVIASSWIYHYTLKKSEEQLLLQSDYEKEQLYVQYYQSMLKEQEQHQLIIHDIENHLQSILALNEDNCNDQIASYIDHLLSDYQLLAPVELSSNKLINSICNKYRSLCAKEQIAFFTDIRSNCLSNVSDHEITAILCNLLDNAVEEAQYISNSYVELNICKKNEFTYINIINSCRICNPEYNSATKKRIHPHKILPNGLGLKSVEQIITHYNGMIEYHTDAEQHAFHIIVSLQCN